MTARTITPEHVRRLMGAGNEEYSDQELMDMYALMVRIAHGALEMARRRHGQLAEATA